jgi:heterogeneous nuclear ribonucleoprotein L
MSSSSSSSPKEETYEEDREFESQAKRLKTEEGEIVYSAEESENRQEATPQAGSDSDSGGGDGGDGDGGSGGGGDGEEGEGGEEGDEGDGDEGGSGGDEGGSGGGPRSMPLSTVTKRGAAPRPSSRARRRGFGLAAFAAACTPSA